MFIAENFEHMKAEETENHAVLTRRYSDDELHAIESAIVASLTPQESMAGLRWMIGHVKYRRAGLYAGWHEARGSAGSIRTRASARARGTQPARLLQARTGTRLSLRDPEQPHRAHDAQTKASAPGFLDTKKCASFGQTSLQQNQACFQIVRQSRQGQLRVES